MIGEIIFGSCEGAADRGSSALGPVAQEESNGRGKRRDQEGRAEKRLLFAQAKASEKPVDGSKTSHLAIKNPGGLGHFEDR